MRKSVSDNPSRHQAIFDYFAQQIHQGECKPGQKLPTEQEMVEMFDVSRQTVLRALDQLKTRGMIVRHQGKGSFVAPQPVGNRELAMKHTIAVVCSSLRDSLAHHVVIGAESLLVKAGYEMILCNSQYDVMLEASHLRRLHARGVEGVILVPFLPPANEKLVESLTTDKDHPMRVVCVDRGFDQLNLPLVDIDNYQAAYDAVSYLIDMGHRRIGFIITTQSMLEAIGPIQERFRGYQQALKDRGIRFDCNLITELGPELATRRPLDVGLENFGYQPMHKLLCLKRPPTAVFLLWDELAPGALSAIENSGLRVPEDISLLGFNDDLLASLMTPSLTTVRQPAQELGSQAARILVQLIEGQQMVSRRVRLNGRFIPRSSTAAAVEADAVVAG